MWSRERTLSYAEEGESTWFGRLESGWIINRHWAPDPVCFQGLAGPELAEHPPAVAYAWPEQRTLTAAEYGVLARALRFAGPVVVWSFPVINLRSDAQIEQERVFGRARRPAEASQIVERRIDCGPHFRWPSGRESCVPGTRRYWGAARLCDDDLGLVGEMVTQERYLYTDASADWPRSADALAAAWDDLRRFGAMWHLGPGVAPLLPFIAERVQRGELFMHFVTLVRAGLPRFRTVAITYGAQESLQRFRQGLEHVTRVVDRPLDAIGSDA